MKYIIIATVLLFTSVKAVADTRMDLLVAESNFRASSERVLAIKGKPDPFLASYRDVNAVKKELMPQIVRILDNNVAVSCVELGALASSTADARNKPSASRVLDTALKDYNEKLGDWVMAQCFDLKGQQ
ncbi:hypothetical protein ACO0FB_000041 [Cronobacter sakazakii]|nr:hypothetical protein [Cronobacter sakazakii]ELQ6210820.1 hypothetical protein [Cronobacter sakazakii]ELY3447766.1 hypothetical protein [Cronobacter sakazakii]ELY3463902.1 hypothetical protein [Cronobacter sakazakii]